MRNIFYLGKWAFTRIGQQHLGYAHGMSKFPLLSRLKIFFSLANRAGRFVLGHAVSEFLLCNGGLLLLFLTDPGDAGAHTSGLAG